MFPDWTLLCSGALAENNRLSETEQVIGAYKKLMSATRGEVECVVTSAAVSVNHDGYWSLVQCGK